jgi:eukaryotic-like serine/threonine-protein kinase
MPSTPATDDPLDPVDPVGPTLVRAGSGAHSVGSTETPFKAGDRVAENIELVSLLGVGGMGDVWLANHIGLDTKVAVKFMSAALAHDGALIERFAREAKLSSRIRSPHVVQIFDFATTFEGIPYIVMELIEGETLDARIRRESKLGLDAASRIVIQMCRALGKAHEIGIIHRDMKPENVLLGEEEGELFVRILDFGIAKHIDAPTGVTGAGTTMGTLSYMSPEQLFHPADVDHRSDLWSLGVMTYLCLTGSLPYPGDSFGAVCVAINGGTYPRASRLNSEIPKALDEWFSKALALSSEERFQDAKEMSDAYLLVLEGAGQLPPWAARKEAVEGEPPSFSAGTSGIAASLVPPRPARARRGRVAAVVIGGAMLLAAGFFSRDASVGRLVKAHVAPQWSPLVDRLRIEPAIEPPLVGTPNPVAQAPSAIVTLAPVPVANAPAAEPAAQPPMPKAHDVARSVLRPAVVARAHVAVGPSAESESNDPYSESDAAALAPQPANPPSPLPGYAPAL